MLEIFFFLLIYFLLVKVWEKSHLRISKRGYRSVLISFMAGPESTTTSVLYRWMPNRTWIKAKVGKFSFLIIDESSSEHRSGPEIFVFQSLDHSDLEEDFSGFVEIIL